MTDHFLLLVRMAMIGHPTPRVNPEKEEASISNSVIIMDSQIGSCRGSSPYVLAHHPSREGSHELRALRGLEPRHPSMISGDHRI
jgi:hypothetical protein